MTRRLTIDRGNSATKVAVWDGSRLVESAKIPGGTVDRIISAVDCTGVARAIFCSVAGGFDSLSERLAERGIALLTLRHDTPLPLKVEYRTPQTLGLDRLAAAVGAAALFPGRELLIVDIGTCVTYDRVSADGRFLGGNIAPGIGMRLEAMHSFTSALPKVGSRGETPLWGFSTETAMRSGAVNGVVGEVTHYRSLLPSDTVVALTGGWAESLAERLTFPVEVRRELVNQGLNSILQYNETL